MSEVKKGFGVDLGSLKMTVRQDPSPAVSREVDAAGVALGFVPREPGRRGRAPSPRTDQIHAKVMPGVAAEIANEAQRRGTTQGVIIEEAWQLYRQRLLTEEA